MTTRVLNLLHSISASSKHFSHRELASVHMSVRHIGDLDFVLAKETQEPSSGQWIVLLSFLWSRGMAGDLSVSAKGCVWWQDGVGLLQYDMK